ncbi:hypothetical protein Sango_2404800 [Sesamum angolense]|uniref:Tf2-1-like SH3-like domain-containing protein n=1 Tax=Sesamum angolense TaxID=2727404 RepID=A0AAE1W753_9LAMI|nr:hypothetical protein Sango_2404800 [Sesamum angolense]
MARPPPTIAAHVLGSSPIAALDDAFFCRDHILYKDKHHLSLTRFQMKQQTDRHRQTCVFNIGDWGLLRLQAYRQHLVHCPSSHKLTKRFFGSFQIHRHIGEVTYKLDLPEGSCVHPVFHVSLLKLFHDNTPTATDSLPSDSLTLTPDPQPLDILGQRSIQMPVGPQT